MINLQAFDVIYKKIPKHVTLFLSEQLKLFLEMEKKLFFELKIVHKIHLIPATICKLALLIVVGVDLIVALSKNLQAVLGMLNILKEANVKFVPLGLVL